MKRIKTTKSGLYKLVLGRMKRLGWDGHVPMRYTAFSKVPRSPSYFLSWVADDCRYQAYLTACMGRALLTVTQCELFYGRTVRREVFHISLKKLEKRRMVDERPRKAARRAAV